MKTLIFPYIGKEAEAYIREAEQRGEKFLAVGPECPAIPNIHAPNFWQAFTHYLHVNKITHLFCPVASVHKFMESFPHGLVLLGESPIKRQMREHNELMERSMRLQSGAPNIYLHELAGILKAAMNIYGESNDEKLTAMIGIFANAPEGDVIEVGSLCGRTAFVLRWCAIRYHHQFMLTVDPWSSVAGVQHDSPPLLKAMTEEWDWDAVAEMFAVNLAPLGHINHLRMPSAEAYNQYVFNPSDDSQIAVLHIDGNHDYTSVKQDIELWCSQLASGGWLILDDYTWAHGDGPRRAGDELLAEGRHEHFFECGNALFVRFK